MEQPISPGDGSNVQLIDRAVAVLLALEAGPRSLAELVATTDLARATAHRLAVALEAHDLVTRDTVGRFALGPAMARLGEAAAGSTSPRLVALARPLLVALRDRTSESVQLYVPRPSARVCVISLESPHSLRTIVPVGAVLPLQRGSAGRLLAGESPGRGGWLESVEEREAGVASVSAPVSSSGSGGRTLVAAVSVSGPIERTSRSPGRRYGKAVAAAAAALEAALAE